MVRPIAFGFNPEAAESNAFQTNTTNSSKTDISTSATKEFETMLANLKSHGVQVTVFNDTLSPTKPDAVFPNNWISFQPDGTRILYPMCVSVRRAEIREDIYSSVKIKHESNQSVIDLREYIDESQYLEGTGSIVFDHVSKTAFACRSCRTHDAVLVDLCERIGYEAVIFDAVDGSGTAIYHTNVILSIGDGWAAVCLDFVKQKDMVLEKLEKIGAKVFELDSKAVKGFSGNCFEAKTDGDKNAFIISQSGLDNLPTDFRQFIEANLVICATDIPTIEKFGGGSARCMVAGIYY
jgi:hypothetical protein